MKIERGEEQKLIHANHALAHDDPQGERWCALPVVRPQLPTYIAPVAATVLAVLRDGDERGKTHPTNVTFVSDAGSCELEGRAKKQTSRRIKQCPAHYAPASHPSPR